jgi:hypothetical protein
MKRLLGSLQRLVVVALLMATLTPDLEAKSYGSGGGRSYSSSRSSSSGGSRSGGSSMGSSRSSSPSRSSSGSSRSPSPSPSRSSGSGSTSSRSSSSDRSGSSKGFTSESGKSYGSRSSSSDDGSYTSGKSYTSGAGQKSEPDSTRFTFDTGAARARKEEASRKSFNDYKESMARKNTPTGSETPSAGGGGVPPRIGDNRTTTGAGGSPTGNGGWNGRGSYIPDGTTVRTRPWRMYDTFAPYYSRPVVIYRDSYNSFFWWWLLDRSLDERAQWAYHHRYDMDPSRYQALVAENRDLETRVEQLEAQRVPRDTNYVPANLDRDLMYSDRHVSQVYSNRPTAAGAVIFWLLAIPTALGVGAFFVWLIFFKRWQVSTA